MGYQLSWLGSAISAVCVEADAWPTHVSPCSGECQRANWSLHEGLNHSLILFCPVPTPRQGESAAAGVHAHPAPVPHQRSPGGRGLLNGVGNEHGR